MIFRVSYDTNLTFAKQILLEMLMKDERVYKEPTPFINVSEYGQSSINITVRVWTKTKDYWPLYWDMMNNVKFEFDKNGIEIPINQLELKIRK